MCAHCCLRNNLFYCVLPKLIELFHNFRTKGRVTIRCTASIKIVCFLLKSVLAYRNMVVHVVLTLLCLWTFVWLVVSCLSSQQVWLIFALQPRLPGRCWVFSSGKSVHISNSEWHAWLELVQKRAWKYKGSILWLVWRSDSSHKHML